jgi:hypothetical protein
LTDISPISKKNIKDTIKNLGLSIYYEYDNTIIIEKVHVNKIFALKNIKSIVNVIELKLNFGWNNPTTPIIPPTNNNEQLSN